MDKIKKTIIFLWMEIWHGNMTVIIPTAMFIYYIAYPSYNKFLDTLTNNSQATTEVAMNVHELREIVKKLEAKVDSDFKKRRAGEIGSTGF